MEKRGEYSRGVAFLILLAFIVLLGAVVVLANIDSPTGFVSKNVGETTNTNSYEGCCSGYCQESYTFGTNTVAQTEKCSFGNKRTPSCSCELSELPNGAKKLGNPTCTIQYFECQK